MLCRRKECRRPLPRLAVQHEDCFCSTECARKEYGTYRPSWREMARMARQVTGVRAENAKVD